MKKKIILSTVGVLVLVGAAFLIFGGSKKSDESGLPKVKVSKGDIVDKALAVGTIEPENEISVKAKVSGVVGRIFADAGSWVKAGDPLLEVKPDPAPLELADAKRQVQLSEVEVNNLQKESVRQESLAKKKLIAERTTKTSSGVTRRQNSGSGWHGKNLRSCRAERSGSRTRKLNPLSRHRSADMS